ncbi:MAG: hypothetical protein LBK94_12900 [Prevotellaceae bacterium]|jgi:hypothetical protein|nr:hypothetical protein [Prevotellaceae bacterium]
MNKKLTIYSDNFIWIKGAKGLIYNPRNGDYLLFDVTDEIENICNQLNIYSNLYGINLDVDSLHPTTREFVQNIIDKKFGFINSIETEIISLPPLLNILNDVEKLKQDKTRSEGENILSYFSTITLYTGGICKNKDYYKQTFYPYCSDKILQAKKITDFLNEIKSPYLNKLI